MPNMTPMNKYSGEYPNVKKCIGFMIYHMFFMLKNIEHISSKHVITDKYEAKIGIRMLIKQWQARYSSLSPLSSL